jgi:hypothetical protein
VDWENTSVWRLWFFTYFSASFVLLLVYSFWAGLLTSGDKTVSVWPQMSIVAMQSMLLFMFWLNIVSMEEQLISLNKVIENSPASAKVRQAVLWPRMGSWDHHSVMCWPNSMGVLVGWYQPTMGHQPVNTAPS